jgi:hypothetical protein
MVVSALTSRDVDLKAQRVVKQVPGLSIMATRAIPSPNRYRSVREAYSTLLVQPRHGFQRLCTTTVLCVLNIRHMIILYRRENENDSVEVLVHDWYR